MTLSNQTLNDGLALHMEFGKNWLADIDKRLAEKYPDLTESDLRKVDKLCRQLTKKAREFVLNHPNKNEEEITFVDALDFKAFMSNQHKWINEENLSQLYSQSCYYALK